MGAGFTRRDAASKKGTVMSETTTTEPVVETPTIVEPVTKTDEPLGAPGLAALQAEREAREKAEKRLKEFEDRDKTEAEKLTERATAAEKRAEELEAKAIRAEVAAAKGVPVTLLSGSTQEELEASADALITFRGQQANNSLVASKEGNSPTVQPNGDKEFAKALFSSGD